MLKSFALFVCLMLICGTIWMHAQSTGDDLAAALANHGMDAVTSPIAAAAIEIAIANNNALLARVANDEAAIAKLQQQVATLTPGTTPAPASIYALSVSLNAARSAGVNLNGATVTGSVYVFTSLTANVQNANPLGIASVCYLLDGAPIRPDCETVTPYDFMGTGLPAWNSTSVPNGTHTITQRVAMISGAIETDTATFTVAN